MSAKDRYSPKQTYNKDSTNKNNKNNISINKNNRSIYESSVYESSDDARINVPNSDTSSCDAGPGFVGEVLDFRIGEASVWAPVLSEQESGGFAGQRLDRALAALSGHSRAHMQKIIHAGQVRVNGQTVQPNRLLKLGDHLRLELPAPFPDILPENLPLAIVYEDDFLLVVNKPQGMVVHPAAGIWQGTLVNALLYHCRELSGIAGPLRPGIVHRLDKDTSGLLLVAKNDAAHQYLARQIKEHKVERAYRAIIHGVFADQSVTIDAPIGRDPHDRRKMTVQAHNSRRAVTHVEVIRRFAEFTEISAVLETGRIHQIRVHLAWLGHPVAGDPFYGPNPSYRGLRGQLLHAERLGFVHPDTGLTMRFTAPPPPLYQDILTDLSGN